MDKKNASREWHLLVECRPCCMEKYAAFTAETQRSSHGWTETTRKDWVYSWGSVLESGLNPGLFLYFNIPLICKGIAGIVNGLKVEPAPGWPDRYLWFPYAQRKATNDESWAIFAAVRWNVSARWRNDRQQSAQSFFGWTPLKRRKIWR